MGKDGLFCRLTCPQNAKVELVTVAVRVYPTEGGKVPSGQPFLRDFQSQTVGYNIFLSSGSDVVAERDRFEQITQTVSRQIYWTYFDSPPVVGLNVIRWEHSAPQKTDGDSNARFREQAERCQQTVVLLHNDIRPGTREELEAALAADSVQLSVIWMEPASERAKVTRELRKFLNSVNNQVLWERTGPPGSDAAWHSMIKVVTKTTFEILREISQSGTSAGPHYEQY